MELARVAVRFPAIADFSCVHKYLRLKIVLCYLEICVRSITKKGLINVFNFERS